MASLFPGMDPYLEGPDWLDFHVVFITALRGALSRSLPSHYRTRIDERVNLIETRSYDRTLYKPDLSIERRPHGMAGIPAIQGAVGTVSRNRITLPLPAVEEIRETHIEISHKPSNKLVAIIEILSPWNKAGGAGNSEYLAKRRQVLRQPVHLIEIDLLMCGLRLPLDVPLPPADYYALVSRSDQRPNCEVYPWKLRESLPTLAVPLDAPIWMSPLICKPFLKRPMRPGDMAVIFSCMRGNQWALPSLNRKRHGQAKLSGRRATIGARTNKTIG